jgi:hypothetical protein
MRRSVPGGLSIPVLIAWVAVYGAFAVYVYRQFRFVQSPAPEARLVELQKGREDADRRLKQMETDLNELKRQLAATDVAGSGKHRMKKK